MDTFTKIVRTYKIRNRPELHFLMGQSVFFAGFLSNSQNLSSLTTVAKEKTCKLKILVVHSSPSLHQIELRMSDEDFKSDDDFQSTFEDIKEVFGRSDGAERIISLLNNYSTKHS